MSEPGPPSGVVNVLFTDVEAANADEFPDGILGFELAAVTDPAAVPDAVAAVLGITQQPGKTVSESVAAAHPNRGMLVRPVLVSVAVMMAVVAFVG